MCSAERGWREQPGDREKRFRLAGSAVSVRHLSICQMCAMALLWREGSIASMGPLPGAGAEEIAARWPAQVPAGQRMVPLMRSAQPARAPSSAATPRALASAGALQGANQEPHASSHSHRHPVCAQGCPSQGIVFLLSECQYAPCVYILIHSAYNVLNASAAYLHLRGVPWSFAVPCLWGL